MKSTAMPVANSVLQQQSTVVVTVPQQANLRRKSIKKTIRGLAVSCFVSLLSKQSAQLYRDQFYKGAFSEVW